MSVKFLERDHGPRLAYVKTDGDSGNLPTVLFLGGFRSDMQGTKALYLEGQMCQARGQAFVRFDYSGHGESDGAFTDGTIGGWMQDALDILDVLTEGPVVVVGSSMGGWLALLLALQRPDRVRGVVGIAAAPDFTQEIESRMQSVQRVDLKEKGFFELPSDYADGPYIITSRFLEDGRTHCLLDREDGIDLDIPVRLIQGVRDTDVAWQTAHRIKNALRGADVEVCLVEDGDHRLSRTQDLNLIGRSVMAVSDKVAAG